MVLSRGQGKIARAMARGKNGIFLIPWLSTTESGTMFTVTGASNFEIFSSTGAGAIQANGYAISHAGDPRIFNIVNNVENFSIHDLILVDCKNTPPKDYADKRLMACSPG